MWRNSDILVAEPHVTSIAQLQDSHTHATLTTQIYTCTQQSREVQLITKDEARF